MKKGGQGGFKIFKSGAPYTMAATPKTIYLKDYQAPHYLVETIDLIFDLHEDFTTVKAQLQIRANGHDGKTLPLILDGQELELSSIALDGHALEKTDYQLDKEHLTIPAPGASFELATEVRIKPQLNTSLMGLYKSSGNFCTQCEAEGFRRITYFIDRPDNLAIFTVTIIGDKDRYPVLMSNGNFTDRGDLPANRIWRKWHDPFKKAGHLFALVAGNFDILRDHFVTQSGRNVTLSLYLEHGNLNKGYHAMNALKQAMRWDEQVYGREYDLDIFMTVAVSDFNMGAMENKGLNIFNSAAILASPETATDADYERITRVVGHEYFHNWSGNRVGCRDWFQLSLKEGFTVFRDQSFTADMTSAPVKRIEDVKMLRTLQFNEDAGPLAHPVRPASYMEINNFYTLTVYEKGAELIHMLHTLLGAEDFRTATDLYFSRFDGKVATTDDFVDCMQEVSKIDLQQFRLWYDQAGTPELTVHDSYDAAAQEYTLSIKQMTPPTPGQAEKKPLHIPVAMGLVNEQGGAWDLIINGTDLGKTTVLNVREFDNTFIFSGIKEKPVPSLLRGFSAPVKCHYDYDELQLKVLLLYDTDPFTRWEASQTLALRQLLHLVGCLQEQKVLFVEPAYILIVKRLLSHTELDPAFLALLLMLPSEAYLTEFVNPIDPIIIHQAREVLRLQLAEQLRSEWLICYTENHDAGAYQYNNVASGKRMLKNVALSYLLALPDESLQTMAYNQYQGASNMTDRFAALSLLANSQAVQRDKALSNFYELFEKDALVLDKWFAVQATSMLPNTFKNVQRLTKHKAFNIKNPNKVRALIGNFSKNNPLHFHALNGSGYEFLADYVLQLDALNPQIASRLVEPLTHWRRYKLEHAQLMKAQLERIMLTKLSKDTYEVVSKALV